MIDAAESSWARSLLRNNVRATVFLTLFAAITAAASMTAWEFARRADSVIDRRVERFAPGDGALNSCPPGADPSTGLVPCWAPESNQIAYDALVESSNVEAASFVISAGLVIAASPDGAANDAFGWSVVDATGPVGVPNVLDGRSVDEAAADEIMLSEGSTSALGLSVGDTVWVTVCEFDLGQPTRACSDQHPLELVGITRTDRDLVPAREAPPGLDLAEQEFSAITTHAWYEEVGHLYPGPPLTTFRLADGGTLDGVRADVDTGLPDGWTVLVAPNEGVTVYDGLRHTTQLQGRALVAVAAIVALAGAVFVGQALVRQVRRELADHEIATALGLTSGQVVKIAAMRGAVVAVPAAVLAIVGATATSPLGPPGLAGDAEIDRGLDIDPVVLVVGGALVAVGVLAVVGGTAWRQLRATRRRAFRVAPPSVAGVMSPTASAGLVLGRSGRSGGSVRAAVLGTAAMVVAVVTASILVDSLRSVEHEPHRYGVSWQYSTYDSLDEEAIGAMVDRVGADPLITDAAFAFSSGPIELPSVPPFWLVSFAEVKGDLGPVIVSGRAPSADDEVAVAPATLQSLELEVGDTIELPVLVSGGAVDPSMDAADLVVGPFTIVGVALISDDTHSVGPGKGIVLTEAARQSIDPAVSPMMLVRTDPAVSPIETARSLDAEYGTVAIPSPQADVGNLLLLVDTPWLIALLVSALAVAALAHALITLVRRSRREIGVLRALGFTRHQVVRAVCWQSTALAIPAIAIGIPLGIVAGRWGWSLVADQAGLVSPAVVDWIVPIGCAVLVLVVANAIAAATGLRAGHRDLADSLRAE